MLTSVRETSHRNAALAASPIESNIVLRASSLLLSFVFVACANAGGCSGPGGGMGEPIPGHFNRAFVDQNVVQARMSPAGFAFIESDLEGLVKAALGHELKFKIPKTQVGTTSYYMCAPSGCDAVLDIKDGSLHIVRNAPINGISTVDIEARVDLTVDNILLANAADPANTCRIDLAYKNHFSEICNVNVAGSATSAAPSSNSFKPTCDSFCRTTTPAPGRLIRASIGFGIDEMLGHPTLTVNDVQVILNNGKLRDDASVNERCPAMADVRPIQFNRPTSCGSDAKCRLIEQTTLSNAPGVCFAAQLGGDALTSSMQAIMHDAAMHALRSQLAEILTVPCTTGEECQDGTTCQMTQIAEGWSCSGQTCLLPPVNKQVCMANGIAVPPLMGIEAQQDLTTIAPEIFTATAGPMKVIAGLGGQLKTEDTGNGGVVTSGFFGIDTNRARCVVPKSRPQRHTIAPLELGETARVFDAASMTEQEGPYHAAISVHRDMLNQVAWGVYTNGAMCMTFGGTEELAIDSQALSLLIGSLDGLYGDKKSPAYINIVPGELPEFRIGHGSLKGSPDARTVDSPHLEVLVNKLDVEFYSLLADRYVRLFTLRVNYKVGVFFDFNANDELLPVIGNAQDGVSNIEVTNVELLGNDVQDLEKAIPAMLDLALPVVTSKLLQPIKLPTSNIAPGYRFRLLGLAGQRPTTGNAERFDFITGFARIERLGPAREIAMPTEARAQVARLDAGDAEHLPTVELVLDAAGADPVEFSYRMDNGVFTPFTTERRLVLQRPSLRAPGTHKVEVIARRVGKRDTLSTEPTVVSFVMPQASTNHIGVKLTPVRAQGCSQNSQDLSAVALVAACLLLLRSRPSRRVH